MRRVRDPETGRNVVVESMTYQEWAEKKKALQNSNEDIIIGSGTPESNFDRTARKYSLDEDLALTNPNYSPLSHEWSTNCQRCVPAYEMRRRGFKVSAKPQPCSDTRNDALAMDPTLAWFNARPVAFNSRKDIETALASWGDGARAQIKVAWKRGGDGHTFIAEQRNGKTVFLDPQTGSADCSEYFREIAPNNGFGNRAFWWIDTLSPSDKILDCCENKGV